MMHDASIWEVWLLTSLCGVPAGAVVALATARWARGRRASEATVARVASWGFGFSTLASGILALRLLVTGSDAIVADLGSWFTVGHYAFPWILVGDGLSLPFTFFSSGLIWVIARFSRRYLHREEGFHRFYLMLSFFGVGVQLVVLAGTLDLIFFGWEIVGLTSALLIAFFHERRAPVEHGLRAFVTYRFCDIGLLSAAVWLHHEVGSSILVPSAEGGVPWNVLPTPGSGSSALVVALLLLWASMGKAAQFPLGGWLPRAMEGPTPSSAIFYGAISIHLGPYLLLRASDVLASSPVAGGCVITIGAVTALHGTFVGRVQTDVKSALAYASMSQAGVILVEIGLGWQTLALIHVIGHAALRSLQILRSPSLLHDHHHLEQAMGNTLPRTGGHLERWVPARVQPWLYRAALERGYLDDLLTDRVVSPMLRAAHAVDALEQRWARWLAGETGETGAAATDGADALRRAR